MPYQGHGWGYRYLHGFLGSLCLLAAMSWMRLAEGGQVAPAQRRAVFAGALAVSLAIILPVRGVQAHAFEHPYSTGMQRIQASTAEVAMIDDYSLWFGIDFVRNRPFLDNRPIVLAANVLKGDQMPTQCARRKVAWFGPEDMEKVGVRRATRAAARPAGPRPAGPRPGCR